MVRPMMPGATLPGAAQPTRLITHRAEHSMVAGVTEMPLTWSVVIPVKVLARAKSRLAGLAGPARSELALAMAADTVRAAAACPVVATVVVVTDDPAAASALGALGAWVVADEPDAGAPARPAEAAEAAEAAATLEQRLAQVEERLAELERRLGER